LGTRNSWRTRDFWEQEILVNKRFLGTRDSWEQEILGNKRFFGILQTRDLGEEIRIGGSTIIELSIV